MQTLQSAQDHAQSLQSAQDHVQTLQRAQDYAQSLHRVQRSMRRVVSGGLAICGRVHTTGGFLPGNLKVLENSWEPKQK